MILDQMPNTSMDSPFKYTTYNIMIKLINISFQLIYPLFIKFTFIDHIHKNHTSTPINYQFSLILTNN